MTIFSEAPWILGEKRFSRLLLFVSLLCLLGNGSAHAQSDSPTGASDRSSIVLGAGLLNYNSAKATNDSATGAKPWVGQLYPGITLAFLLPITSHLVLSPDFYFNPLGKKSPEGGETSKVFSGGVRLLRTLGASWDVHLGSGLLYRQISGSGGTKVLNNGSSQAVFGIPNGSSTSSVGYLGFGIGWNSKRLRVDVAVLTSGLGSSRRAFNPLVGLGWRLF